MGDTRIQHCTWECIQHRFVVRIKYWEYRQISRIRVRRACITVLVYLPPASTGLPPNVRKNPRKYEALNWCSHFPTERTSVASNSSALRYIPAEMMEKQNTNTNALALFWLQLTSFDLLWPNSINFVKLKCNVTKSKNSWHTILIAPDMNYNQGVSISSEKSVESPKKSKTIFTKSY